MVKPPQQTTTVQNNLEAKEGTKEDPAIVKGKVLQLYVQNVQEIKGNFKEKLLELFFLQSGGNMVDYITWKQKFLYQISINDMLRTMIHPI